MRGKLVVLTVAALLIGAALAVLWLMTRAPQPAPPPSAPVEQLPPGVALLDRFGSLDARHWRVSDRARDGWHVENDLRPSQVGAHNGLVILLDTASGEHGAHYTSGEIQSARAFQYGYYEARMRVPRGAGVVTGFFTYAGGGRGVSAHEIDVEILGRDTRRVYLTYHVGGRGTEKVVELPFDAADGFHVYGFEWTSDALRWYIDNRLVYEASGPGVARLNRPQTLIVNLWGTEALYRWAGRIDPVEAPWRLEVACIAQAERYMGRALC